jgi:two-component system OmpR family sensor kinase
VSARSPVVVNTPEPEPLVATPGGGALSRAERAERARRRLWPRRSLRNQLALLFFLITFSAIAVVYFYVAPSLGSSLTQQKLLALASSAELYSDRLRDGIPSNVTTKAIKQAVHRAANSSGERVTLVSVTGTPKQTSRFQVKIMEDSASGLNNGSALILAYSSAQVGRTLTHVEVGADGGVGEAAYPVMHDKRVVRVVVLAEPLNDVARSVAAIRGKILLAGAIALLLAVVAGYLVARALSQRVKRLEQAAWRVADGDFTARFEVDSQDELGQLARALGAMQRQLAELDSARERFIATASHELRTPIFSLGGFLELIQDEELDEETRMQFVGQVRSQVARLGRLATDLLDLSRLEAGGLELHPESADLAMIARAVTAEFTPALGQHASRLRLRLMYEPLLVVCDPERVAQIMRILIDNAITHTPIGTDMVVTATRVPGEQTGSSRARLMVRDYGPGVPESTLPRIFEPFYTSAGVGGSGLGLAIAHELAERMAGRLSAESSPGRTVLTLELPA